MPITILDGAFVTIVLISALLAMIRGLSREILAIISWVFAGLAAYYIYPFLSPKIAPYIGDIISKNWIARNSWVADFSAATLVFLITLIVISLITTRIADFVADSKIGALDRSLGFVFGVGRGIILVVVTMIFFNKLVMVENQPKWITQAKSKPMLDKIGEAIIQLIPDNADIDNMGTTEFGKDRDDDQNAENKI